MASLRCFVQGSVAIVVPGPHIGALLKQELQDLQIYLLCSDVEGAPTSSENDQKATLKLPATAPQLFVAVGHSFETPLHRFLVPISGRGENGFTSKRLSQDQIKKASEALAHSPMATVLCQPALAELHVWLWIPSLCPQSHEAICLQLDVPDIQDA